MKQLTLFLFFSFLSMQAAAHHSVLHYDGKVEVVISGVVTAAKFAFPHSVYKIAVTTEDGDVEDWILSTEDPRDAERLGFAEELKALKAGDEIKVVGWPHRFNEKEIRGHQLHYPDGRVVFMRRGNYIWPKDIKRLDRFVYNPETLDGVITIVDSGMSMVDQVIAWAAEGDAVARAAFETVQERARLIGIADGGAAVYSGVNELLICHTERADFTMSIDTTLISADQKSELTAATAYIAQYNRLLSRWWEQERSSCE